MDCRRDCRIVHRQGSKVSLTPEFFGVASQNGRCFGTIKKVLYEDTKHMCIGRRMGLPLLLTLIYLNWKH